VLLKVALHGRMQGGRAFAKLSNDTRRLRVDEFVIRRNLEQRRIRFGTRDVRESSG
jgi:hypothetical protein